MKRIVSLFLGLGIVLSCCTVSFAAETNGSEMNAKTDEIEYLKGEDLVLENIEILENGFVAVTEKVSEDVALADSGKARPEQERTAVFTHKIFDRNGKVMAILTSTVTGVYSQVDRTAFLTSIKGTFQGSFASDFSCSTSVSGSTGKINLYYNGMSAGSFSCKIYSNGTIQNI